MERAGDPGSDTGDDIEIPQYHDDDAVQDSIDADRLRADGRERPPIDQIQPGSVFDFASVAHDQVRCDRVVVCGGVLRLPEPRPGEPGDVSVRYEGCDAIFTADLNRLREIRSDTDWFATATGQAKLATGDDSLPATPVTTPSPKQMPARQSAARRHVGSPLNPNAARAPSAQRVVRHRESSPDFDEPPRSKFRDESQRSPNQDAPSPSGASMQTDDDEGPSSPPPPRVTRSQSTSERDRRNAGVLVIQMAWRRWCLKQRCERRVTLRAFRDKFGRTNRLQPHSSTTKPIFCKPVVARDAQSKMCDGNCDRCAGRVFTCLHKDCQFHGFRFESQEEEANHHSLHCSVVQDAVCTKRPAYKRCDQCKDIMVGPGPRHESCSLQFTFTEKPGETDEQRNDRFEAEIMSGFTIDTVIEAAAQIPDELLKATDIPTVTSPRFDRSLLEWVRIGIDRLLDFALNEAHPMEVQWAAFKIFQLKEVMLFHVPPAVVTTTLDYSHELTAAIDYHASLFVQGKFVKLIDMMVRRRDYLRSKPKRARALAQLIVSAVRRTKFKQARTLVKDQAKRREVARLLGPEQSRACLLDACSRTHVPDDDYSEEHCFADLHKECVSEMLRTHPRLFDGKAILEGCKGIKPQASGGPSGAKKEQRLHLYGKNLQLYEKIATMYDRFLRCSVRGTTGATWIGIKVRDFLTSKGVFAISKPGKPDQGRGIAPPCVDSKCLADAIIKPAYPVLRQFLKPCQVAFQRPGGNIALNTMLQSAQDFSEGKFADWLKRQKGGVSQQIICVFFDLVKMYPSTRRRYVMKWLLKLIADSTVNKPAWRRICVAHVIFYGAPIADFHDDAVHGLITDLIAQDGYCIGDFLASIFAFLGSAFLAKEAIGDQARETCDAHLLASADNAVIVGEVQHVVMIVRRMIEISRAEDLADFQEQQVLRTVPVGFQSGAFDQRTEDGREAICARLQGAVNQSVVMSYDGSPADPDVLAFFAAAECNVTGLKNLGGCIGNVPYRAGKMKDASKIYAEELETARRVPGIDAQTLGSLFAYSMQQTFQHHVKQQPADILLKAAKSVDMAGYKFIAPLTDYDPHQTPGGPHLSSIQQAVADLPESKAGLGKVNHADRVRAGGYAAGVVASIILAKDTGSAIVQRLCVQALVTECNRHASNRRTGTVAYHYARARENRLSLYPGDKLLPADPSKLVKEDEANGTRAAVGLAPRRVQHHGVVKTLYGRIIAPSHKRREKWLHDQKAQWKQLSTTDQQCLITLEQRAQTSSGGGSARFFSVPPVSSLVRVTGFEHRFTVTMALGNAAPTLHSNVQGVKCPKCPNHPKIKDDRHFLSCAFCGWSFVHNSVRDAAALVSIRATEPRVSARIEPRRYAVGCGPDHRGGPDMLIFASKTVLDFKSLNPNADRNQTRITRDIKAHVKEQARVGNQSPGTRQASSSGRSDDVTDLNLDRERVVDKLIAQTEPGADAQAAAGIGLELVAVPVCTVAAVHGNVWKALMPALLKDDGEADERCTIGWPITGVRSLIMQATVMAAVRAAGENALRCARGVCLSAGVDKPNVSTSAWPVEHNTFAFDYHIDQDIQVISDDQQHSDLDPMTVDDEAQQIDDRQPVTLTVPLDQSSSANDETPTLHTRFGAIEPKDTTGKKPKVTKTEKRVSFSNDSSL